MDYELEITIEDGALVIEIVNEDFIIIGRGQLDLSELKEALDGLEET